MDCVNGDYLPPIRKQIAEPFFGKRIGGSLISTRLATHDR